MTPKDLRKHEDSEEKPHDVNHERGERKEKAHRGKRKKKHHISSVRHREFQTTGRKASRKKRPTEGVNHQGG